METEIINILNKLNDMELASVENELNSWRIPSVLKKMYSGRTGSYPEFIEFSEPIRVFVLKKLGKKKLFFYFRTEFIKHQNAKLVLTPDEFEKYWESDSNKQFREENLLRNSKYW